MKIAQVSDQWLAGFFDGEGSVGIWSQGVNQVPSLNVQITQCDEDVIRSIRDYLNVGFVRHIESKRAWLYCAKGFQCEPLLQAIFPFVIVKREQVRLGLDYLDELRSIYSHQSKHSNLNAGQKDVVFSYTKKLKELKVA